MQPLIASIGQGYLDEFSFGEYLIRVFSHAICIETLESWNLSNSNDIVKYLVCTRIFIDQVNLF